MALELVNPDPRYGKVHLLEPAPLGYLHLAAEVQVAHRPGPVLHRTRQKHQLLGVLKWQARRLAQADTVERATVYDAIAFTPPGGYVKDRPAPLPPAWFDVVVLVETVSPEAAAEVRASPAYQELGGTLTDQARRVHQVAARNVRRVGDVDKSRPGLFLFNWQRFRHQRHAAPVVIASGWFAASGDLARFAGWPPTATQGWSRGSLGWARHPPRAKC